MRNLNKIVYITMALVILLMAKKSTFSQVYSRIDYDAGTSFEIQTGADVCANEIFINGVYSGGGTICDGPNPVILIKFTAAAQKNNVKLDWSTENEINNYGFDLERKTVKEGATWQKICFIMGNGTTTEPKVYFYEDKILSAGRYCYRLKQLDFNGNYEFYDLSDEVIIGTPKDYNLTQNYPNPSNPRSKIDYCIPIDAMVSIKVYDILGREVAVLVNEFKQADYYSVDWDGSSFASGVYYYKLISGAFVETKKMILLK